MNKFQKMLVLKGIPSLVVGAFTMAIMVLILVACLMSTGCGTVCARGYAERTGPDGVVTRAAYTAIGFGEKSAMALEGLGIDSDAEAPGVFLQKGDTEQDTTKLMQSLIQLGAILGPIVQQRFATASQQQTGVSTDSTSSEYQSFTQASTGNPLKATAQNIVAVKSADGSIDGGEGSLTIVVLGNRAACSYCKTLWGTVDFGAVSSDLCGASVVDADLTANPEVYKTSRPKDTAFSYPLIMVYNEKKEFAGKFVARNMSQAAIIAKVKELVPSCASAE
jgi:hypothetical protein